MRSRTREIYNKLGFSTDIFEHNKARVSSENISLIPVFKTGLNRKFKWNVHRRTIFHQDFDFMIVEEAMRNLNLATNKEIKPVHLFFLQPSENKFKIDRKKILSRAGKDRFNHVELPLEEILKEIELVSTHVESQRKIARTNLDSYKYHLAFLNLTHLGKDSDYWTNKEKFLKIFKAIFNSARCGIYVYPIVRTGVAPHSFIKMFNVIFFPFGKEDEAKKFEHVKTDSLKILIKIGYVINGKSLYGLNSLEDEKTIKKARQVKNYRTIETAIKKVKRLQNEKHP